MTVGFIFDLDGVLTDTAEYHFHSWEKIADEQGWHFTRQDNERLRGLPRLDSLQIILEINHVTMPRPEQEALATRKNEYYLQLIQEISPTDLLPGVQGLLEDAKAQGIKIGLGSASKNAREVIERLGILPYFDALGDGFSVVRGKPAPDIFIWVAGRLELSPKECIVFEDAEAGIEAALTAGFWTVGIGPENRIGKAHHVRANLQGATAAEFKLPLIK